MSTRTRTRWKNPLLFFSASLLLVVWGIAAVIFYEPADGKSLKTFVQYVYDLHGVVVYNLPEGRDASGGALLGLLLLTITATVTGLAGILAEVSPMARDMLLRLRFVAARWQGKQSVALVGLGFVGGALARELRRDDRKQPVYAAALDTDSPTAIAARRAGALVIVGDMRDAEVRESIVRDHTRHIVIATGDDVRNVEIAELLRKHECEREQPFEIHVHVADPAFGQTLRKNGFSEQGEDSTSCHLFSVLDLAARQLFLDPEIGIARRADLVPCTPDEVLHLFVFGFGALGQAVALQAAHSAHFANGLRTRLTVFHDDPDAVARFQSHHPAFAPPTLDLSAPNFLNHPRADAWCTRPGRPADAHFHSPERVVVHKRDASVLPEGTAPDASAGLSVVHPIEYAVNAEYRALPRDGDVVGAIEAVHQRLVPEAGPRVKAAAVFCFEDEQRVLHDALRFRRALIERVPAGTHARLPIYVDLPTEQGLITFLDNRARIEAATEEERRHKLAEKQEGTDEDGLLLRDTYPLIAFGQQEDIAGIDDIVQDALHEDARLIRRVYDTLRPGRANHHEFDRSDQSAARFLATRFDHLGIELISEDEIQQRSLDPAAALFLPLMDGLVLKKAQQYEKGEEIDEQKAMSPSDAQGTASKRTHIGLSDTERGFLASAPEATRTLAEPTIPIGCLTLDESKWANLSRLPEAARDRVILSNTIGLSKQPTDGLVLKRLAASQAAFERFAQYLALGRLAEPGDAMDAAVVRTARNGLETVAMMEHNRWMGERLVAGWHFGSRSDTRRTRITFVPWDDLDEHERLFDRAALAAKVLKVGRQPSDLRLAEEHDLRHFAYPKRPAAATPNLAARPA